MSDNEIQTGTVYLYCNGEVSDTNLKLYFVHGMTYRPRKPVSFLVREVGLDGQLEGPSREVYGFFKDLNRVIEITSNLGLSKIAGSLRWAATADPWGMSSKRCQTVESQVAGFAPCAKKKERKDLSGYEHFVLTLKTWEVPSELAVRT